MTRTYRRDSNGRFASGGGGGGSKGGDRKKGASSASRKSAINDRKRAMNRDLRTGQDGGYNSPAFRKQTQRARYMKSQNSTSYSAAAFRGKGNKAAKRATAVQAKAVQASRSKAFSSKTANKARDAYKAARSKAREAVMLAGGRTSTRGVKNAGLKQTVKAAQSAAAKVRAMEKNRGRKRTSRKK